ncbi:MAG: Uma2 family endonuclease, partial [Anaerolineaceae bacterium]|nr:Uma2 family endonuclease [Anaerolineaceae bacterium]
MVSPSRSASITVNPLVASFTDINMDEFVALVAANPDTHYRFNAAGDAILMSGKYIHSRVQSLISTHFDLWLWTDALPGYGSITECLYDLGEWRCCPDVAISPEQGNTIPREAPLVAVEIRSDSNPWPELREKARRYLQHGTQMVWLVDTDERSLEIHRAGDAQQTLTGDAVIEGGALLPGFR